MYTFQIISRMNTRSTSYNKKSVVLAISNCGLQYTQKGIFLTVVVPDLEKRRKLEYELQQVDRNVYYKIELS